MELLVLWLATCIASFGMELSNELQMFKDVADAGYKIDLNRLSEAQKQLNPNATNNSLISLMIPIYNLLKVFETRIKYNNARPMLLDQLHVIDALEEMSDLEKEEYKKHPTGLNALLVQTKTNVRLSKATKLKIDDEDEIFFEFNHSKDNRSDSILDYITILKATGNFQGLSEIELKQKVINFFKELANEGIKTYGSEEKFFKEIEKASKNKENLVLNIENNDEKNDVDQEPINTTLSNNQKIQALKELKQELEEKKQASQNNVQHQEKGSSFKKKRK